MLRQPLDAPVDRPIRRRKARRWAAGVLVLAVLVPGVSTSVVPPVHRTGRLKEWKQNETKIFSTYGTNCYQEVKDRTDGTNGSGSSSSAACGDPDTSGNQNPPTYWTAYYHWDFDWKGDTYIFEVTVPFSYWADMGAEYRIQVDRIRVELTGPGDDLVLNWLKLWDGNGGYPIKCENIWLRDYYTKRDCGPTSNVRYDSDSQPGGGIVDGVARLYRYGEVPEVYFKIPIVPKRWGPQDQWPSGCWTPNYGEGYRCNGYVRIDPA